MSITLCASKAVDRIPVKNVPVWELGAVSAVVRTMQLIYKVVVLFTVLFIFLFGLDSYLDYRLSPAASQSTTLSSIPSTLEADQFSLIPIWIMAEPQLNVILQQNLVVFGLGLVWCLLLLSWLLKRMLRASMIGFKQIVLELADGDYLAANRLPVEGELVFVSKALKRMVSEIVQREQAINQQKRLYAALSHTGKLILRNPSPQELFEGVCKIAVSYGGFKAAWIGEVDREAESIHPIACTGLHREHLKVCKFGPDLTDPQGNSPLATAVYEKCPSVIGRIGQEQGKSTWHRLAQLSGGQSAAVFPILVESEVIAALTVYADDLDYFSPITHSLLDEMVSDLAFAIENHKRNQAHKLAHESLEVSSKQLGEVNKQLSLLLESTGEGIFGVDDQDRCTFINKAAADMLGYARHDLLGRPIHQQVRMFDEAGVSFNCMTLLKGQSVRVTDESFLRNNETLFPVEYSTYPILESGDFKGSVTVFRDVTSTRSMMREMRFLATHDSLTHLLNRHAFDQHLRQAFANSKAHGDEHVLLYMDLDQFKLVNDTCGHVAGDMMLRQLAHQLQLTIGDNDILARLGGDEFGLLMENRNLSQANRLANQIGSVVKRFRFAWKGRNFTTGVSIGIVAIGPNTESPHSALSAADAACYVAKDMGRNRVHVYQPYDEEINRQQGEMRLVTKIESAIDHERFSLLQQPIMSLRSNAIGDEHIELLLRMQDEVGNQIMPSAFIPAAERYNIMGNLDRWVIGEAFKWLSENPSRLEELGLCAINLSGQSLGDAGLHEFILEKLRYYDLPVEKISFEITETAVVSRLDQAIRFISLLKRRGFRFALDDFGSGMSSFAYLKRLPVDYLKIDGSFVRNILSDPVDRAMVESINHIGHLMGLQTIAEYVESDLILEQLIDVGVDYVQGFGVMPPMPLSRDEGTSTSLSPLH
jgi:diguanylate cyclase (GGDEF)-like protein/PAS domain S-box-containing protein